ncbi:MAG TPA: hypothetical protein VKQ36_00125, partial [Ktedonobacterales bacterium]|nr:hypothetical protein [Ktedonobacterales bacterium]
MARGDRDSGPGMQHSGQGAKQNKPNPQEQRATQREARRERYDKTMSVRAAHRRSEKEAKAKAGHSALPTLTDAQTAAVKTLLAQIPTLAATLRGAANASREEIGKKLVSVTSAEEPVAQVFAARLGDARGPVAPDAVEIAQMVGALDPRRAVAREGRRAVIRLRSAGASPQLAIPLPAPQTVSLAEAPSVASGARAIHIHP